MKTYANDTDDGRDVSSGYADNRRTDARSAATRHSRSRDARDDYEGDDAETSAPRPRRHSRSSGIGDVSISPALLVAALLVVAALLGAVLYLLLPSPDDNGLAANGNGTDGATNGGVLASVSGLLSGDGSGQYVFASVTQGDQGFSVTAVGNLKPVTEITVGSEISGIIKNIAVNTNDTVVKDQPIAWIDTSRFEQQAEALRAAAGRAKTRVAQAEATLREAEVAYKRNTDLFEKSGGRAPSKVVIDTVTGDYERAKENLAATNAEFSAAEARLNATLTDIAKAVIKSPVDGVVLKRNCEPGQTVAAGFRAPELFVVAEKLERMKVVVGVAEADIARVAVGQRATFTVDAWGRKTYPAQVTKVEAAATDTNNVKTYDVELNVPNDNLSLRTGMTATATIATAGGSGRAALLVPTEAFDFTPPGELRATPSAPGGGVLWAFVNGHPTPVEVRRGAVRDGQFTSVSGEGVSPGMRIIVGLKRS
jgi:HlyD family secretion protein